MKGSTCYCTALYYLLAKIVEHESELALFSASVILVNNSLSNSLIYLFNGVEISSVSKLLVAGSYSSLVLLDSSLHSSFEHLVLKCLCLGNEDSLLCGLNVRQTTHLLNKRSFFRTNE